MNEIPLYEQRSGEIAMPTILTKPGALLLTLSLGFICAAADRGAQGAAPEQATAIADTVHKLAAVEPPNKDIPIDVPAAARPLLTQLKHELRDLILSALNDPASRTENAVQPAESIIKKLEVCGLGLRLTSRLFCSRSQTTTVGTNRRGWPWANTASRWPTSASSRWTLGYLSDLTFIATLSSATVSLACPPSRSFPRISSTSGSGYLGRKRGGGPFPRWWIS